MDPRSEGLSLSKPKGRSGSLGALNLRTSGSARTANPPPLKHYPSLADGVEEKAQGIPRSYGSDSSALRRKPGKAATASSLPKAASDNLRFSAGKVRSTGNMRQQIAGNANAGDNNAGIRRDGRMVPVNANYQVIQVVGNGSFGVVFLARDSLSNDIVAIKKVLQDPRFKNRELDIIKTVSHPNIVGLRHYYFQHGTEKPEDVYLCLVLEYVPESLCGFCRKFAKQGRKRLPSFYIKLFTYQMARAMWYIHSLGICHRDIKPQNILVNPETGELKVCDFGSAKKLVRGEPNVSYICSRYYRAPELIFGVVEYTHAIDIWAVGCVMAELLQLEPLFQGQTSLDQLVEIIKVLGNPNPSEMEALKRGGTGPNMNIRLSRVEGEGLERRLPSGAPPGALSLLSSLLSYDPTQRPKPWDICLHPFMDDLRRSNAVLPNGRPLPVSLFEISEEEMRIVPVERRAEVVNGLVPEHMRVEREREREAGAGVAAVTSSSSSGANSPHNA